MVKKYDLEELDKLFLKEGSNVEKFCKKHGIPKTTLRGHLRRVKEKKTMEVQSKEETSQIVPVTLLKTADQDAVGKQASFSLIKLHINEKPERSISALCRFHIIKLIVDRGDQRYVQ